MNPEKDKTPTHGQRSPVEEVGDVVEKIVKQKRKVRCSACAYTWNTITQLLWVTCPNCRKNCNVSQCLVEDPAVTHG